ncbi:MAG: ADP-ribosylglycohydrolase family protein [Clostridia bacterium]
MNGAILGDIAGSRIEFSRPKGFKHREEPLFIGACRYTDDTVLSIATKYAILNNISYAKAYNKFGKRYRKAGYGNMFQEWLDNNSRVGYKSYGNGSAMRVSFIGEHFSSLEEVHKQAELSSICTHDHKRGIMAAKATAGMIFLAKNGYTKNEIKKYLSKNYDYPIHKPLFFYRPNAKFDPTADGTMPVVIRSFLESESWEDCIRNAFSIKCDTDTVCCIAGGIAEAFHKKTGMDDKKLLERYLIKPNENGIFDKFLYEWAMKK